MTGDPEKDSAESAIDADFEPAPAADYVLPKKASARSGPGWLPFGLVSALAIGALGLSAYTLNETVSGAPASDESALAERIGKLEAAQKSSADDLSSVRESVSASEERMAAEIKALLSGDEDGEGLEALVAELEAVSGRLDDAMAGTGDSDALKAFEARLSALEDVGDAKAVSPGEATSILASLRQRIEALEAEDKEILKNLDERTKARTAMIARIADLEFALEPGQSTEGPKETFVLADLQAELENLKKTVERTEGMEEENRKRFTEMLSGLEMAGEADQQRENMQNAAAAALALSRIEAAAREGRAFSAAYKQLSEAQPGDAAVQRLARFSSSGAPTLRQLSQQFAGDRDAALDAADESADDGWGWTRQVFGSGVKVRRAGSAGGARDLLANAEDALAAGDLEAAINALDDLPEEPKKIMEDWTASAEARLALQKALDDVVLRSTVQDR